MSEMFRNAVIANCPVGGNLRKPETGNCLVSLSAAWKLRSIFNFREKNEVFSTKWNKYESVG